MENTTVHAMNNLLRNNDATKILWISLIIIQNKGSRLEPYIGSVRPAGTITEVFHLALSVHDGINYLPILCQVIWVNKLLPYFSGMVHIF